MKIKKLLLSILMVLSIGIVSIVGIKAAYTFSVGASTGTVNPGGSFSVTVSVPGSGMFFASANNASVSPASQYCDSSCTFYATAGSSGTATVTISAGQAGTQYEVTAFADDSAITGSKSVNVSIYKPQNNQSSSGSSSSRPSGGGASTSTPVEEEKDVTLKSLEVSEGSLTPVFSAETHDYEVIVSNKVEKLEVKAEASDANATVEGTGEITLKEATTKVDVKVINAEESGIYTLTIVKETPVVYVDDYGILNEFRNADVLEGFEEYKIKIDGVDVIAKKNPVTNVVVVYALDQEDQKSYYIYNEKKKEITSIYKPIALLGNSYVMISIPEKYKEMDGFKFGKVKIGEQEFEGWSFTDKKFKDYSLVYFMDKNGEEHFYQYEESEQTLQIYNGSVPITQTTYTALQEELKMYQMMTYILAPTAGVIAIAALALAIAMKKRRK